MKSLICVYMVMQLLVAESKPLEDVFIPCHKSDPHFRKCLWNFISGQLALVNNEIPGYKSPFTNPYIIPTANINLDIENVGSTNGTFKNIKITNAFKVKVNDLKYDLENMVFECNLTHPKIGIELEYVLDGKLYHISAHSEGFVKAKLTLINSILRVKLGTVERKGVKHYVADDLQLQMYIGDAAVQIISNNPEEQSIANFVQNVFNENAREYLDILNPMYVERIRERLRSLLDSTLAVVPADKILQE